MADETTLEDCMFEGRSPYSIRRKDGGEWEPLGAPFEQVGYGLRRDGTVMRKHSECVPRWRRWLRLLSR